MHKHTCLYCDVELPRRNQKVCKEHRAHHDLVLHYKRRGRDINDRSCTDCGTDIRDRAGNAKRCLGCTRIEKNRDQRERKARQSGPKSARPCKFCGEKIGADRRRDMTFCSRECIDDYRAKFVDRTEYIRSTQSARTAYTSEWRKGNPASVRLSKYRRRAREAGGKISERDWQRLIARYENRCAYCDTECVATLDHVVPLSRGGTNTIGNALPACRPCNSSKHNKFLSEWKFVKAVRGAAG